MSRFTKISRTGKPLPDTAKTWAAVLDSETGLMWQADQSKQRATFTEAATIAADLTLGRRLFGVRHSATVNGRLRPRGAGTAGVSPGPSDQEAPEPFGHLADLAQVEVRRTALAS